jgi:hypothetical protein
VYDWLLCKRADLPVPLITCRLLLSPLENELAKLPDPGQGVLSATLESVLAAAAEWRMDAATRSDNVTLFYFAGHGFQTTHGSHILILADFGDELGGLLKNAIDAVRLIDGMAPSSRFKHIARRQFYFLDACRMRASEAAQYETLEATSVWDLPVLDERDDRVKPVYHTAEPGSPAFCIPREQTYFSKALLRCVEGDGAEKLSGDQWGITAASLARGLEHHMTVLERQYRRRQRIKVSDASRIAVLRRFGEAPRLEFDIEVVPKELAPDVAMSVNDLRLPEATYGPPLHPHPFPVSLTVGPYLVTTRRMGQTETPPVQRLMNVEPPPATWSVEV